MSALHNRSQGAGKQAYLACWQRRVRLPEASFLGLSVKPYIHTADGKREGEKQRKTLFRLTACRSTCMVSQKAWWQKLLLFLHWTSPKCEEKSRKSWVKHSIDINARPIGRILGQAHCIFNVQLCPFLYLSLDIRKQLTHPSNFHLIISFTIFLPLLGKELQECLGWVSATPKVLPNLVPTLYHSWETAVKKR